MTTRDTPATVVPLLATGQIGRPTGLNGKVWLTWGEARRQKVRIPRHIKRAIGPRRRGVVYRSGYWGTLATVHQVFLEVGDITHRGRTVKAAVWFQVVEQDNHDVTEVAGRIRRHCTSWSDDDIGRKDEALFTIEVISQDGGKDAGTNT